MVIPIFEHYEKVKESGCDRLIRMDDTYSVKDCKNCDLYQKKRKECILDEDKKWEAWNKAEHERFGKILRGE